MLRRDLRNDLWERDNGDASFSSKKVLLNKDTHLEKPREGWVTAGLRHFLFRLQTPKAPGILQPLQDDSGSTLQIHICEQPANSELLHLPQVPYKPNHFKYSLPLTLLLYYFSQAERSMLKSNNQLQHVQNSLIHPPMTWQNPMFHRSTKRFTQPIRAASVEKGTTLKPERSVSFPQSSPNSNTKPPLQLHKTHQLRKRSGNCASYNHKNIYKINIKIKSHPTVKGTTLSPTHQHAATAHPIVLWSHQPHEAPLNQQIQYTYKPAWNTPSRCLLVWDSCNTGISDQHVHLFAFDEL